MLMDIGTVALRGVVGPLFVGHGTQKLFGWFGGHGLDGTGGFFESIGLRPGRRNAMAAGIAEAGGGALLTLGALTPLGATMVAGTMVTAIRKVHLPNGPWVTENGYEYNATIIAAMATLVQHGPGTPSVDAVVFPNLKGKGWAVASLAAAIAGSFLMDKLNETAPTEASMGDTSAGTGTPQAMTDAADTVTSTASSTT
jgi:putative oxidoreductase